MLRVCSVSFASNSWPSADAGHSKRRCWAKFWPSADAENAHSGVGLPACGSLAPLGGSHESHSNSPLIDHLGVHPNTWGAPPFFLLCYGVPVAFFSVIF